MSLVPNLKQKKNNREFFFLLSKTRKFSFHDHHTTQHEMLHFVIGLLKTQWNETFDRGSMENEERNCVLPVLPG